MIARTIYHFFAVLVSCTIIVAANRPNVMIIFADDVGTGDVPGYWDDDLMVDMPNLKKLVEDGTTVTQAYRYSKIYSSSSFSCWGINQKSSFASYFFFSSISLFLIIS